MTLPFLALSMFSTASAFCGTYVGSANADIVNDRSEVAYYRDGRVSTLTVRNTYQGPREDFALVIPVPEVISEEKVNVLAPEVFDHLDAYSSPRLVSYSCEDWDTDTDSDTDADTDADSDADTDVEVHDNYIVGEYEVVILSAVQSESLFSWLSDNGYSVPQTSKPLLQEYIEANSYFLAAKVAGAALPDDVLFSPSELSPLQFSYETDAFSLPIRIGTLNADGAQDLTIYALNKTSSGQVGIANYPEVTVPNTCIWEPETDQSFTAFYEDLFEQAWEAEDRRAIWMTEYAWSTSWCDPCVVEPPDHAMLRSLGLSEDHAHWNSFLTRIRVRYTPETAREDLVLYLSGNESRHQQRYITHTSECVEAYPLCVAATPGSAASPSDPHEPLVVPSPGCDAAAVSPLVLASLGVLPLFYRRRSPSV